MTSLALFSTRICRAFASGLFCAVFLAGSAHAEASSGATASASRSSTASAKPTDPLDTLCAKIGAPVSAKELQEFSRYRISPIAGGYTEDLRWFRNDQARSVRYLANGNKSAHLATIKGRDLCLSVPGSDTPVCGVPLKCASKEADFVMVDSNDKPFVRIDKPKPPAPDAKPVSEYHDWVPFAGGTVALNIKNTALATSAEVQGLDARPSGPCSVGAGLPGLDASYAFFWESDNSCSNGNAAGPGRVVYLSQKGRISYAELGDGLGVMTKGGRLFWSFPKTPIRLWIECEGADGDKIPTTASDVTRVDARMIIPERVLDGQPIVYRKIAKAVDSYIQQICRIDPATTRIQYQDLSSFTSNTTYLDMISPGDNTLQVQTDHSPDVTEFHQLLADNLNSWQATFGKFTSNHVRTAWRKQVIGAMQDSLKLPNVANGMEINTVETLVSLSGRLSIQMPWDNHSLTYNNGNFRVDWYEFSDSPVTDFLQRHSNDPGWQQLAPYMKNEHVSRVNLTCVIPKSAAQRLPLTNWASVQATLTHVDQNNLVLDCTAE